MAKAMEAIDQRRFTVEEYRRMGETGIFKPGERVELVRGVVRRMSPKNRAHVVALSKTLKQLTVALGNRASIYPEAPLQFGGLDSEPEPDLVVTSSPVMEDYGKIAPSLVIEVSELSLRYDLNDKASLYAQADLPEYWVVNLIDRELVVFRSPDEDGYRERSSYGAGERVAPEAWPDALLEVGEMLPSGDLD